jgi:hypothetical protein
MKKIIALISCFLVSLVVLAGEQTPNALIVKLQDGTENAFILSEKPTVLIQDDKMLVTGVVEVTYLRSEISKFYFEQIKSDDHRIISGIELIGKDNVTIYYVDGENVYISGLKDKTMVSVASLDGKMLSSCRSDASGEVTMSLGNLPKGVYVVTFDKRSIKIIR